MKQRLAIVFFSGLLACLTSSATAFEPGWSGPVFATGATRARIERTPMIYRSYRPFHFYGNTVRRRHYRGTVLPAPRDFVQGTAALLRRRR